MSSSVLAALAFVAAIYPSVGAQQTPPAPAAQAPQAPPGGRGGTPGTESGWATFQQQCFRCHGNTATNAKTTAYAIRLMTPDRIVAGLNAASHTEGKSLSDIQKQRVAETTHDVRHASDGAGADELAMLDITAARRAGDAPVKASARIKSPGKMAYLYALGALTGSPDGPGLRKALEGFLRYQFAVSTGINRSDTGLWEDVPLWMLIHHLRFGEESRNSFEILRGALEYLR